MVYVIQEQKGKNLIPATKYGELKFLLPQGTQITFSAGQAVNKLKIELSDFNDNDYLLLIGDPVAIGITFAVAAEWNQGKVKVLKWDRQESMYYPLSINLYPKKGELHE